MITYINASDRNNLATLSTRKVLNILTDLNALIALFPPVSTVISIILKSTIQPSNKFILSFI
jgi:hypothetical protein